ncbi:MAG TPA: ribosome maturation factor RimM [Candidatus Saccharimonadaceae bacterium]|jgi:16S rRNA processing protein RimM|nr:ribosome maturation factor RimM [Candidatus Saccharimonadaceae bacterium]
MPLVTVGRVGRPHGVNGELLLDSASLSPEELLALRSFTWRGRDGATRNLELEGARPHVQRLIARFQGVTNREGAAELVNGVLLADAAALPDPGPGMAYTFQLIGLEVRTEDGRALGKLEDIVKTGAHPIYVVQGTREWLIPATSEVVRHVDLAGGAITVRLPVGLEDV